MGRGFWAGRVGGGKGKKRVNPETIITNQIRELLKIMRIPHRKHWAGPMSDRGIPDIIGTLPGPTKTMQAEEIAYSHPAGRALWIEVKVRGSRIRPEQLDFIEQMQTAGAVAFFAYGPEDVLRELQKISFGPAMRIQAQFPGQSEAAAKAPPEPPNPEANA